MLSANIMAIAAVIETTYGVDGNPNPATAAIEASGISPKPYNGNDVQSDVVKPYYGGTVSRKTGVHSTVSFSVELSASGTAGTAPGVGVLLRGCGYSETVSANTSVTYAQVKTEDLNNSESLTIDVYLDGEKHKMTGARGKVKFDFSGDLPKLDFEFTGFYHKPIASVFSATSFNYDVFKKALPVTYGNTEFSLAGYECVLSSYDLDDALGITFRDMPNFKGVIHSGREFSSSVSIDTPVMADKDFYALLESHENVSFIPLVLTHGKTAGQIVEINQPKNQITDLATGDSDGILQYNLSLSVLPTNGNDEMTITFK